MLIAFGMLAILPIETNQTNSVFRGIHTMKKFSPLLLAVVLQAGGAQAATVTIDFEAYADNTLITTQYSPLGVTLLATNRPVRFCSR